VRLIMFYNINSFDLKVMFGSPEKTSDL